MSENQLPFQEAFTSPPELDLEGIDDETIEDIRQQTGTEYFDSLTKQVVAKLKSYAGEIDKPPDYNPDTDPLHKSTIKNAKAIVAVVMFAGAVYGVKKYRDRKHSE